MLLAEETVFSPLYILAYFVEDSLAIGVWVYFWALYSVPLIRMSVFVPIQRCFDYCSFVVFCEVWEGYASCFVLSPQEYFDSLV